jgi:hypothetical protein
VTFTTEMSAGLRCNRFETSRAQRCSYRRPCFAAALDGRCYMNQRPNSLTSSRSALALLVSGYLVFSETGCATQQPQAETQSASQPVYSVSAQPAQAPTQDLDQLVAPIALYPDALVAQVLAAATYPTEIVEADRWMKDNSALKGDALAKAVDQQQWDPSVKALTQFPDVLAMMDNNLSWTSAVGEAYGANQASVLDAVQQMRRKAQQAGNLKSTPQETVTTQDQTIAIQPADPEVVYVPEYDPWLVYGSPIAYYPGWVVAPGLYADDPGIFFGVGIGIGIFGGFGWGWHHWGADWHHHYVDFDHHRFVSHSPTFGHFRPEDGRGAFGRPGAIPHAGDFRGGGFHPGEFHAGGTASAPHPSAFSGFNHKGIAGSYAARGAASVGASHAAFAGGGFHGGGFHGGGGGHR